MALLHAAPGEPCDVRPLGTALRQTPTTALFKSEQLEVIRLVLTKGKVLPPHKVPGAITIQCIEGSLDIQAQGTVRRLAPGGLLFLPGGVVHAVTAVDDSSALLTIVLAVE